MSNVPFQGATSGTGSHVPKPCGTPHTWIAPRLWLDERPEDLAGDPVFIDVRSDGQFDGIRTLLLVPETGGVQEIVLTKNALKEELDDPNLLRIPVRRTLFERPEFLQSYASVKTKIMKVSYRVVISYFDLALEGTGCSLIRMTALGSISP